MKSASFSAPDTQQGEVQRWKMEGQHAPGSWYQRAAACCWGSCWRLPAHFSSSLLQESQETVYLCSLLSPPLLQLGFSGQVPISCCNNATGPHVRPAAPRASPLPAGSRKLGTTGTSPELPSRVSQHRMLLLTDLASSCDCRRSSSPRAHLNPVPRTSFWGQGQGTRLSDLFTSPLSTEGPSEQAPEEGTDSLIAVPRGPAPSDPAHTAPKQKPWYQHGRKLLCWGCSLKGELLSWTQNPGRF